MNISQLRESKFLKRADVGRGILVTIKGDVYQENIAKEGAPEELKWVIEFEECDKPLVLNSTNGQLIAHITGSDESSNWRGHKVVLFDDPSVSFGGKLVGGIRIRAPRGPKLHVPSHGQNLPDNIRPRPTPEVAPTAAEAQERIADQQRYNEIAAATLARAEDARRAFGGGPRQPTSGINNPVLRNPPPEPEPPTQEEDDVPFNYVDAIPR